LICLHLFPPGLQPSFLERILKVRATELSTLWRSMMVASVNFILLNAIPTMVCGWMSLLN
jgi:hypothetical protein